MLKVQGVEYRTIKFKDKKIQTYCFGDGDNVVLALPPFPHSGVIYLNLTKFNLHRNLKFISFDIPGWIGNSENLFENKDFDIIDIIGICNEILDEYDVKTFSLLGFSFGTAIETLFASLTKAKLKKLVFISPMITSQYGDDDKNVKLLTRLYPLRPGGILKRYQSSRFKNVYSKVMLKNGLSIEFINEYAKLILNSSPKVLLQSLHFLFQNNYGYLINNFAKKPLLVINSRTENPMFRKNAELLRIKSSNEKSIFLNGRHEDFILYPNPKVYNQIFSFLIA